MKATLITLKQLILKHFAFIKRLSTAAPKFMPVFIRFTIKLPLTIRTFKSRDLEVNTEDVTSTVGVTGFARKLPGTGRTNRYVN